MAGHSHWKSIKHKKAVVDARRGKQWSKIARLIIIAAKRGGNPNENLALRYAIEKARAANMPNDTIDKNIKRGTGELAGINYETVLYEGYGPNGVAILVDALTDNRHRTAGEIRLAFDRNGGSIGAANSVGWMFTMKGMIFVEAGRASEEQVMDLSLDAGADDVISSDDGFQIVTSVAAYDKVRAALSAAKIEIAAAELNNVASQTVDVSAEQAETVHKLIEALEDNDDVQNVYTNAVLPETV
jgi:YebC/PmpR family DNA-binding regulatory protein